MKKIFYITFIYLLLLGIAVSLPVAVFAQTQPTSSSSTNQTSDEIMNQLKAAAGPKGAGLGVPQDPRITVANIIRTVLELLGTIALVLVVYAGFLWMTAGGNEDKIGKAKQLLFQSVIGLAIILSAYSITLMIIKIALGKWTDYQNGIYIQDTLPIECHGLSCP